MPKFTSIVDLLPQHFELWDNGLLWVKDKEVLVAIARGEIKELRGLANTIWRYPLRVRRTGRGTSCLMGSDEITNAIKRELFPAHQDLPSLWTSNELEARSEDIVDPLIREGVLVMTKPANNPEEQDLHWADDEWFVQNLKGRVKTHLP